MISIKMKSYEHFKSENIGVFMEITQYIY